MTEEMTEEDKVLEVLLWIRNLPSPYITEAEESDTSDSLVKYPSDPESPKSLPSRKSSLDSPRSSSPTIRPSPRSKGKSCKRVKKSINMPAVRSNQPAFNKDDKVLCFHGELLYEAKILDTRLSVPSDPASAHQYRVHYKGWKNTWDDWVPGERIRKPTEENKDLARTLQREYTTSTKKPSTSSATKSHKKKPGDEDSTRASEERQNSLPATSRKRGREDLDKEEAYISRPEIHIPCPDAIKAILVDDWEHITKNLELVTLPSKKPVNVILDEYWAFESVRRPRASADYDLLEETIAGLREYFDKCLGRILLYVFEREQYHEQRRQWAKEDGKSAGDVYGSEHLMRLIVKLPELIAQTNMDPQSIQRLREEMIKFSTWIAKNQALYFFAPYEPASQEYIEKARTN